MENKLTNWKNLAKYEWLGAYSLDGVVDEVTLTIKSVSQRRVKGEDGREDDCVVIEFEETTKDGVQVKPMVCNKTNCKVIEEIYKTPFIEQWIGKKITIYVQQGIRVGRTYKPGLRIRNAVPTFKCSVCGKEIEESLYRGSIKKYGAAYCSTPAGHRRMADLWESLVRN